MNLPATIFEGLMIFCWGISWPAAVKKTLKTRSVEGVSILFLWLVFLGYVSGILFKIFSALADGYINPVIILYLFNFAMVAIELVLYYRYSVRKKIRF
jgi:lipopolysaccharide export LptBFGC system permease protein LptF